MPPRRQAVISVKCPQCDKVFQFNPSTTQQLTSEHYSKASSSQVVLYYPIAPMSGKEKVPTRWAGDRSAVWVGFFGVTARAGSFSPSNSRIGTPRADASF